MKPRHIAELVALSLICWSMTSCVTTTNPDGSSTTGPAPGAVEAGALIAYKVLSDK